MGSVSRAYLDEASGVLYAGVRYPGIVDHVAALNMRDGSARTLAEIKGAMLYSVTSLAFDPASRRAFFTTDNLGFRNLIAVDVDSGEETLLLKEARIGSIAFNPVDRSLIGVRHNSGLATLVRIPYPYVGWETVHEFPYGVVPSDLDVSADGRLLSASITDVGGDQFLRVWTLATLLAGNTAPLSEFRFGQSAPESFVFTKDGRYLYGSSYYTGVSNIFRYEVATGDVKAVSNAETGFFRPIPMADGRLVVFSYTGEGFTPAIIEPRPLEDLSAITFLGTEVVARHPVVTTWQVPPANAVDYDSQVKSTGVYRPLGEVQLLNGFPVLEGYKTTAAAGYHLNLGDPLGYRASRHHRRLHARPEPAGQRARPRLRRWPLPRLARRPGLEPLELLRPLRPDAARPQGLRGHARLRPVPDLRAAEEARRPATTSRTTTRSIRCRERRTSRRRSTACSPARSPCATATCAARSAPWRTRRASPGPQSPRGIAWRTRR